MELDPKAEDGSGIKLKVEAFPCTFNMSVTGISIKRMNMLRDRHVHELKDIKVEEETIQKLNFLTFVEYKLNGISSATTWNEKALGTSPTATNVAALANQAYLLWLSGEELEAYEVIEKLEKLESRADYQEFRKRALADQAYAHYRWGGPKNLDKSINLYEEAIKDQDETSEISLWKQQLGVVYRRALHGNVFPQMPGDFSQKKSVERAVSLLLGVIENSTNCTLKGRAFAELVCMSPVTENTFSNALQTVFWERALDYGKRSGDAFLLMTLGKAVPSKETDKIIDVLEKSLEIGPTSTAFHHLGLCYEEKAKKEFGMQISDLPAPESPGGQTIKRVTLLGPQPQSEQEIPKDKNHKLVAKALELYQKAVTEDGLNVPAKYDYGLLLKACGDIKMALKQFNQITNLQSFETGHKSTIILAYEQATKCLLMLHEKETGKLKEKYKEEAKKKLMQAVQISADMAAQTPDMTRLSEDIWAFFRNFYDKNSTSQDEPKVKDKNLLQFIQLVKGYGVETLQVVEDLLKNSDAELEDKNVIEAGLESYLAMERYDEAMVFLKLYQTRPSAMGGDKWETEPLKSLNVRVQLQAAKGKLQSSCGGAIDIFRSLFISQYKVKYPNLLIVHDDSGDSEEGKCDTSQVASMLQAMLSKQFGLDVSRNMQGSAEVGPGLVVLLEEIKRYSAVVLLLGQEPMDSEFEYLLKLIPSIPSDCEKGQTPPTMYVATTDKTVRIPEILRAYRHLCVKETVELLSTLDDAQGPVEGAAGPVDEGSSGFDEKKTQALVDLFCFLAQSSCPKSPIEKRAKEL